MYLSNSQSRRHRCFDRFHDVGVGESRPRRKSLSRLLGDRPKEIDSGHSSSRHVQPLERRFSRIYGFCEAYHGIGLVGRHRRSKSGGTGLALSNLREGQQLAPPLQIAVTSPVLPPLPISTSQLSLRLPSSPSMPNSLHVGGSRYGSMHDLSSSTRMSSVASSQNHGSSIILASSVSARSSRRTSSIHRDLPNQQTPTASRRR